jgi:transcriptional regulator with XRE-family HTH domain
MATQLKAFLSDQIRTLRGTLTQREFGDKIGKPQSVISRLEKQLDRHVSIQTLIDIAVRLDIAVIIRFVDFPTFLRYTEDYSEKALAPFPYDQAAIDTLAEEEERRAQEGEIRALGLGSLQPPDREKIGPPITGGVLATTADPVASYSSDFVDESPAHAAALQAEIIDLVAIRQFQQQYNRTSETQNPPIPPTQPREALRA